MFNTVVKQGFTIRYYTGGKPVYRHYFCGEHCVDGAWCPNCNRPLLHLLTIDPFDPQLQLHNTILLRLFYCWNCHISTEAFYYQLIHDNAIDLIGYGKGTYGNLSPYSAPFKDYPWHFKGTPVELDAIPEEKERFIQQLNSVIVDSSDPQCEQQYSNVYMQYYYSGIIDHQIGGEPLFSVSTWESYSFTFTCPVCTTPMPFLASIGDECLDQRGLLGGQSIDLFFSYCNNCHIVGALSKSD